MCDRNKISFKTVRESSQNMYRYSYLKKGNWTESNVQGLTVYLNQDRAVFLSSADTIPDTFIELVLEVVHDAKKGQSYALLYEHNCCNDDSYGLNSESHRIIFTDDISPQVKDILRNAICNYSSFETTLKLAAEDIIRERKITPDLRTVLNPESAGIRSIMAAVREKMIADPLDCRIAKICRENAAPVYCIAGSCGKTPDQNFKSFVNELGFDMPFPSIKRLACKEGLINIPENESTCQRTLGNLTQIKRGSSNKELSSAKVYDIPFSPEEQTAFDNSLEMAMSKAKTSSDVDSGNDIEKLHTDYKTNSKKECA